MIKTEAATISISVLYILCMLNISANSYLPSTISRKKKSHKAARIHRFVMQRTKIGGKLNACRQKTFHAYHINNQGRFCETNASGEGTGFAPTLPPRLRLPPPSFGCGNANPGWKYIHPAYGPAWVLPAVRTQMQPHWQTPGHK